MMRERVDLASSSKVSECERKLHAEVTSRLSCENTIRYGKRSHMQRRAWRVACKMIRKG